MRSTRWADEMTGKGCRRDDMTGKVYILCPLRSTSFARHLVCASKGCRRDEMTGKECRGRRNECGGRRDEMTGKECRGRRNEMAIDGR
jgi:hypothetical protein